MVVGEVVFNRVIQLETDGWQEKKELARSIN